MPRDESSLKLVFLPVCEAPIVKCVKAGKLEPGSFAAQKKSLSSGSATNIATAEVWSFHF